MVCPEFAERLSAYLDGELGEDEREAMAAHLTACAACRVALAALARLGDLLRATPAPPLGEDLVPGLLAQVTAPEARLRLRWFGHGRRTAIAAAGLVLVLAGASALLLWRAGPPEPGPVMAGRPPAAAEPYLREHAVYAAGQPLADRSSLLLTSFGRGTER